MKDLVVLVADKNMDFLFRGLLPRIPTVENLKDFSFDILVHPHRDPGIFKQADNFLKPFAKNYSYALVVFDHNGCGHEHMTRENIEDIITQKLALSGWNNRSAVICIYPELENWLWVNETKIQKVISWEQKTRLYDWLHQSNWKNSGDSKPTRPKEAFEAAIRLCKTPRSSSLYQSIACQASYRKCRDIAFHKMLSHMRKWFAVKD